MADEGVLSPTMSRANSEAVDLEKAISECSKEQIQIPGFIQPDGALFCVEKKTLRVLQCSANVETMLGIPLHTIIKTEAGGPSQPPLLNNLLGFDAEQVACLCNNEIVGLSLPQVANLPPTRPSHTAIFPQSPLSIKPLSLDSEPEPTTQDNPHKGEFVAFSSMVPSAAATMQLFGALSSTNYDETIQLMIVEIEPCGEKEEYYKRTRLQQKALQRLSRRLAATSDVLEACRVGAEEVRIVTGLDRVMVYEFDREWHGDVLIELTAEGVPKNYVGLRFPAGDVPPQARRLYTINPFRLISNTFYEPCPVLPAINPLTNSPLDMSHATFRSVSPVHVQYMKNINVGASMSISIIVNDAKTQQKKLHGLLSCHHQKPIFLPHDVRETCMVIGQLMSLRVENLQYNKMEEKRMAMKEMVHSIATSHFSSNPPTPISSPGVDDRRKDMTALITEPEEEWMRPDAPYMPPHPLVALAVPSAPEQDSYAQEVLRLFDADYGVIVVESMRRMLGNPDASEVVFLASFEQYVSLNSLSQIVHSNNIAKTLPKALPVAEGYKTSGVLFIPLALDASSYLVLFRYEQVVHVKWAGAPNKQIHVHPVTSQPALISHRKKRTRAREFFLLFIYLFIQ